jgi:hypothetical protein
MRTAILTAIIVLSGALTASPVPAKGVVEIRMRSYYYAAPATVSVVVAVEPGSNNRALVVEADGEDYYRSSEIELDGDKEKRFHTLQFTSLPAGSYVLRAQVLSTSKVLGKAEAELVVSGIVEQP